MTRSLPSLVAAAVALTSLATAQADWTQLLPTNSPSPRAGTVGVTDGALLYLFGGKPDSTTELNDLWVFDGTNWTDITPATGPQPAARDFYGASYDLARGRIVIYGGRSTALATDLGDTWEYDGAGWTQLTPAVSPGNRRWVGMAYDSVRNETILFGGNTGSVYYGDTWSWDGTAWTLKTPANSPAARARGFLSYDVTRGEMIYFGGRNATSSYFSDTWKWDGTDWSQVPTATTPGGIFAYGITYDMARDRHVLFGGTPPGQLNDTWEFDGADWQLHPVTNVPGIRTGPLLTFVPALNKNIMFGGWCAPTAQYGDTWEYQTDAFPTAATYGAGCTGSGGLLGLAPDNLPWIGEPFTATASNLSPGGLAAYLLGFSNTSWTGGGLPVPLAAIYPAGGAGCDLLASDQGVGLLLGTSTVTLPLPNAPVLAGLMIYMQVLEMEFTPAAITAVNSSNGLAIEIGAR